jgi:hypothetical protein
LGRRGAPRVAFTVFLATTDLAGPSRRGGRAGGDGTAAGRRWCGCAAGEGHGGGHGGTRARRNAEGGGVGRGDPARSDARWVREARREPGMRDAGCGDAAMRRCGEAAMRRCGMRRGGEAAARRRGGDRRCGTRTDTAERWEEATRRSVYRCGDGDAAVSTGAEWVGAGSDDGRPCGMRRCDDPVRGGVGLHIAAACESEIQHSRKRRGTRAEATSSGGGDGTPRRPEATGHAGGSRAPWDAVGSGFVHGSSARTFGASKAEC